MSHEIERKEISTGFISGAVSLAASVFIVKIIGFIYKLPLSYILGDEGMGYFNSAYTVFSFFYLLCSGGIPRAVSIMVTELNVKGKQRERRVLLRSALKLFLLIGTMLCFLLILFSRVISVAIGSPRSYFAMICIAPSLIMVSASGVLRGYFNGVCLLVPISVSQVLEGVIKFVFGLCFALLGVRLKLDIEIIAGLTILGVTLASFVCALYLIIKVNSKEKGENTEQKYITSAVSSYLKRILIIAAPLTLSSAIMGISNIIDLGIIMKRLISIGYSDTEAAALYGNYTTLVLPMLNLVTAMITPITVAALPMLTRAHCLEKKDELCHQSKFLIDITAFISMPMGIAFLFYSEEILRLLFNDESAFIAAPLLVLLAPSMIFIPLITMVNTTLEATGHTKAPLISMSCGALAKFILSYTLMGNSNFGISGAPLGTTVSYGISLLISITLMLKYTGIKPVAFASLYKPFCLSFLSVYSSKMLYNLACSGVFSLFCLIVFGIFAVAEYVLLSSICGTFHIKNLKNLSKSPKNDKIS